jgi:hypothetical protein
MVTPISPFSGHLSGLPADVLRHIGSYLPSPYDIGISCKLLKRLFIDNHLYWDEKIKRLGLEHPSVTFKRLGHAPPPPFMSRETVHFFYRRFNVVVHSAEKERNPTFSPKKMRVFGQFQANLTALQGDATLRTNTIKIALNQPAGLFVFEGFRDIFRYLNRHYPMSADERGQRVMSASTDGRLDLVQELLKNNAPISTTWGIQALIVAARSAPPDNLAIVEEILKNVSLDEQLRGLAVMVATEQGSLEFVRALLANCPFSDNDLR